MAILFLLSIKKKSINKNTKSSISACQKYSRRIDILLSLPLIELFAFITFLTPCLAITETRAISHLSPEGNHSVELFIENTDPVHLEIDTSSVSDQLYGKIPIRFYSDSENAIFSRAGTNSHEIFWNNNKATVIEHERLSKPSGDRYIHLKLNTTDEMVGRKIKVMLEKEDNLSKMAAVGAFLPQILPIIAMNNGVIWQPHHFWSTLLRWNYLLLDLNVIHSLRSLITNQIFADNSTLFAQCSADFVEGFSVYSLMTNHGLAPAGPPMSREDTFRTYLRTTPTNRMFDCISRVVTTSLQSLHHEGRLHEVFGNWSMLDTLNDETLEGIAKLMVGYGFNLFANVPGVTLSAIRDDLGLTANVSLAPHFNESLKTSIQYTIHSGYLTFFKGRGWDATSAYALSTSAGLLEIGYRFYRAKKMIDDQGFARTHQDVIHQLTSIGERAEAMASSGYQLIPLPDKVKQYAVPAVATTVLTGLAYYAVNSTGALNTTFTDGLYIALQRGAISATNGLVLGALAIVILPYAKEYGAWLTQLAADKLVSWADSEKDSWIGYFAGRDTQYKIRVVIVN